MKIIGTLPFSPSEIEPDRVETTPDGWDTLVQRRLFSTHGSIPTVGDLAISASIPGRFFFQRASVVGYVLCYPIYELRSEGLRGSKDYTIEGVGFAEQIAGTAAGIPNADDVNIHPVTVSQNRVGIIVRYLTTTKPDCSAVGRRINPQETFGLPDNPWYYLPDPRYHVPDGWVLDKRAPVQLPGTSWYRVTDEYGYYFLKNYNGG